MSVDNKVQTSSSDTEHDNVNQTNSFLPTRTIPSHFISIAQPTMPALAYMCHHQLQVGNLKLSVNRGIWCRRSGLKLMRKQGSLSTSVCEANTLSTEQDFWCHGSVLGVDSLLVERACEDQSVEICGCADSANLVGFWLWLLVLCVVQNESSL
jgi:hypothetical protein